MTQSQIDEFLGIYESKLPHDQVKKLVEYLDENKIPFDYEGILIKEESEAWCPILCLLDNQPEMLNNVRPTTSYLLAMCRFRIIGKKLHSGNMGEYELNRKFIIHYDDVESKWVVKQIVKDVNPEIRRTPRTYNYKMNMDELLEYIGRFI